MTDFDAIYVEDLSDENQEPKNEQEPIIIRGNGNLTIFGLSNRFNTEFPPQLISKIAPEEFSATIIRINSILKKNLPINVKWLCFGCVCCCCSLGFSFLPVICLSKKTKCQINKLLDWENTNLYHKLGLRWTLKRMNCDSNSNSMLEYVLLLEFLPKVAIYKPD
jgi:hypothetical protein